MPRKPLKSPLLPDQTFSSIADTAPVFLWMTNANRDFVYCNTAWRTFTGEDPQSHSQDAWASTIHPSDSRRCLAVFRESHKNHTPFSLEYRLRRNDGSYAWVLDTAIPRFDESNTFLGLTGSAIDIHERKLSEERQAFLSKLSEVLASSLDFRTTLTRIAQLTVPAIADWCEITIVNENGVLDRAAIIHSDPKKIEFAKKLIKEFPLDPNAPGGVPQVIRTGKSELIPYITEKMVEQAIKDPKQLRLVKKIGLTSYMVLPLKTRRLTIGAISLVSAESGHIYSEQDLKFAEEVANYASLAVENSRLFTTAKEELKERREIELSLRASEEKFRRIVESGMIGIIFFDLNGEIIDANNAFLEMTGYTKQELTNGTLKWDALTPEEWRILDTSAIKQLERNGVFKPYEKEYLRKDKSRVPIVLGGALFEGSTTQGVAFILDNSRRKAAEEMVKHQALHDALTGLPNRILLKERLRQACQYAKRTDSGCAVLLLDLDRFKIINDTLGHQAGDDLLKEVANRLRQCIREEDTVSRFGGDEFVLVINDIKDSNDALTVVEKVFACFEKPLQIMDREIYVNTSLGIALYPTDGKEEQSLIKNADIALYQAKESGRKTYSFFSPSAVERSGKSFQLQNELRRAIKEKQFEMYYQPVYASDSLTITGAEALIRWNHPEKGLVPASAFISYAEESGLIHELGEWILSSVCQQINSWKKYPTMSNLQIAINVSPLRFYRHDFIQKFKKIVTARNIDPANLILEVTEGLAMQHIETAIAKLGELRDFGVKIAVDDFGIGHSSLNYLKLLPVHILKIDKSFVQGSVKDETDTAIIRAAGALAENLHLSIVAEGVETKGQLEHLLSLDCCQFVQGNLLSPALHPQEFARLVKKNKRGLNR